MLETIALDSKTILIKADTENELAEIIDFISKKDKRESLDKLFKIARENRVIEKGYKFNRDECY